MGGLLMTKQRINFGFWLMRWAVKFGAFCFLEVLECGCGIIQNEPDKKEKNGFYKRAKEKLINEKERSPLHPSKEKEN